MGGPVVRGRGCAGGRARGGSGVVLGGAGVVFGGLGYSVRGAGHVRGAGYIYLASAEG